MTITFENDSDVIVYALENIISFARDNRYFFVANCVWWIAGILGLESGLMIFIDNLESRIRLGQQAPKTQSTRAVSSTPRDLTEDQRLDQILEIAKERPASSETVRITRSRNRVNPLPQTKNQLKKARKVKRLQEERRKKEADRKIRLQGIRDQAIRNLITE
jgi:hypothetical protein